MSARISRLSLLWKILLSTSIAITMLFAFTGAIVQRQAMNIMSQSIDEEVNSSFQAYDSLWRSRAEMLASVSLVLSGMSDVRAAFSTGDEATIRDTAGEIWSKISHQDAIFLVTDPHGRVIASLGKDGGMPLPRNLAAVPASTAKFPRQAQGFESLGGRLYQIALTPVYVQAGNAPGLLNVLVAGYAVDDALAIRLKQATGGSEFLFLSNGKVIASSMDAATLDRMHVPLSPSRDFGRVSFERADYATLGTPLRDVEGKPIGELRIVRSLESARQRIAVLRRNIILIWMFAIVAGIALTYLLARRILNPVKRLDVAAAEIARRNYEYRVPVESQDEIGRLAQAFNAMCDSIQKGREELIRHERISTIGRLSSSIVHDLRNPLAAIYGGAEMLVDGDLSPAHVKRVSSNIYRASRGIQKLLQELVDVSRSRVHTVEVCCLRDVVMAALDSCATTIEASGISVETLVPAQLEVPVDRDRMERVFLNLINNAIEAMPNGGRL
ncbi:MAG: HAMP domain-containing protein, partial [Acidobacteriota bacterium]|nr:HAMP domain-containing protein [Acidobacteriota bacterium]